MFHAISIKCHTWNLFFFFLICQLKEFQSQRNEPSSTLNSSPATSQAESVPFVNGTAHPPQSQSPPQNVVQQNLSNVEPQQQTTVPPIVQFPVQNFFNDKPSVVESLEKSLKEQSDENDMLQNRLSVSRNRVKLLEGELKSAKDSLESVEKTLSDKYDSRLKQLEQSCEKFETERNELKVLLRQRQIEFDDLQKKYEKSLENEVNVNLFHDDDTSKETEFRLNSLTQEIAIKEHTITELKNVIDQMNREKETSENQYQTYATHLTMEMESLKLKTNELILENDGLGRREQELLQHINALEKQMQQQIQQKNQYEPKKSDDGALKEKLVQLSNKLAEVESVNETFKAQNSVLTSENLKLAQDLSSKDEQLKNLQMQTQNSANSVNYDNLLKELEDKSIAASRALAQNQSLKSQLEEMQKAFITMTNDKVDLMSQMQSNDHINKEMKLQYDAMEFELKEMKSKWQFKENEMIRLSHENTELEKKILQNNIELDRLRHYESKEAHGTSGIVEHELETYRHMVETLTNKIQVLESNGHAHTHDDHHHHEHDHGHEHHHHHENGEKCDTEHDTSKTTELLKEIEFLKVEKDELVKIINDFKIMKQDTSETKNSSPAMPTTTTSHSEVPSIATEEALEKLQARFRRTMLEVAELSDEKQRLEHLVTQLQFETETIGEYITLYQNQRRQLKKKEHERDIELKKLTEERCQMNEKLAYLNKLIEEFVQKHPNDENDDHQDVQKQTKNSENLNRQENAGRILEVLTEIKNTNSKSCDHSIGVENVSCCYGKIETV